MTIDDYFAAMERGLRQNVQTPTHTSAKGSVSFATTMRPTILRLRRILTISTSGRLTDLPQPTSRV